MKKVEDYERIRKAYHIEGLSIREISRRYKHGRKLIRKALEQAAPEPYQIIQPRDAGILGAYQERILALLKRKRTTPPKTAIHRPQDIQASGWGRLYWL